MVVSVSKTPNKISKEEYLSPREIRDYKKIPLIRKKSWLAGRFAVKKSISIYYAKKSHFNLINFKDIEIMSRKFEKPMYKINSQQDDGSLVATGRNANISISHCGRIGAGGIADTAKEGMVGLDIEKVRDFNKSVLRYFLTEKEMGYLRKRESFRWPETATLFWCAKEAYLKAIGSGLLCHPRKIEIKMDDYNNIIELRHCGKKVRMSVKWRKFFKDYLIVRINVFDF